MAYIKKTKDQDDEQNNIQTITGGPSPFPVNSVGTSGVQTPAQQAANSKDPFFDFGAIREQNTDANVS